MTTGILIIAGLAIVGMLVLGVLATMYGVKSGKVAGVNTVLMADAERHSTDLQKIVDGHAEDIRRLKNILAVKREDLKNARDEVDKMHIAIAEGKPDEALKIGQSLSDWLTSDPDADGGDELLAVGGAPSEDEDRDSDSNSPS